MSPLSPFQRASDGKRVTFLTELLRGASASRAATRANLNRGTVYRWKLDDPEFASVWAEIVASRPRRRHLRRRVLEHPGFPEAGNFKTSQLATPAPLADSSPEAAWDNDFGPAFEA